MNFFQRVNGKWKLAIPSAPILMITLTWLGHFLHASYHVCTAMSYLWQQWALCEAEVAVMSNVQWRQKLLFSVSTWPSFVIVLLDPLMVIGTYFSTLRHSSLWNNLFCSHIAFSFLCSGILLSTLFKTTSIRPSYNVLFPAVINFFFFFSGLS
jgi:hypothetical protein